LEGRAQLVKEEKRVVPVVQSLHFLGLEEEVKVCSLNLQN
jgi:hypothetical protein